MVRSFVAVCFLFAIIIDVAVNADVIAILVCDTLAANIEESVERDLDNMRQEVRRIAHYTGQDLKELIFEGFEVDSNSFFSTLTPLALTEEDTVIFFFSGHGFRTRAKDKDNPWPNLYFTASKDGVDYDQVIELFTSKKHRLLLMIADCCNNYVEEELAPPVVRKSHSLTAECVKENYRQLFLYTTGELIAASSRVSEYSWCTSNGALFGGAFLEALKLESEKTAKPSWKQIFYHTCEQVKKFQRPLVEVSIVEG